MNFEEMAATLYGKDKEDEQVVENEATKGPKLTPEQQEFMDWFNSLNLPDYEETDV